MKSALYFLLALPLLLNSCSKTEPSSEQADTLINLNLPIKEKNSINLYSNEQLVDRHNIVLLPDSVKGIIESLGFCKADTIPAYSEKDTVYNYCDVCCFFVTPLCSQWTDLFLLEIKNNGTGTGGNHYFVIKKEKSHYRKINFFMGYVDTVKANASIYDIIFVDFDVFYSPERYRQNYKMKLSWNGSHYDFNKMLEVKNVYANKDSSVVLRNYDPKFNDPEYWKFLSKMP